MELINRCFNEFVPKFSTVIIYSFGSNSVVVLDVRLDFPGLRTEGTQTHRHTHMYIQIYKTVNKLARTLSEETYYAKFSVSGPPPTPPFTTTHAQGSTPKRVSGVGVVGGCGGGGRLLISGLGVVCTTYACCRTVVVQSTDARTTT